MGRFSCQSWRQRIGRVRLTADSCFSATLNKTITDTSKNASGMVFRDFWSWDLGDYDAVCECPEGLLRHRHIIKLLPSPRHSEGERQYFIINNNIQISVDVWVQGHYQDYKTAPFSNLDNLSAARAGCTVGDVRFTTGSKGKLSLYINHPFVGELQIPSTKILDLFGTHKVDVYNASPLASVYLSGSIIVPQGCELSSGSTLEIPFGNLRPLILKIAKDKLQRTPRNSPKSCSLNAPIFPMA